MSKDNLLRIILGIGISFFLLISFVLFGKIQVFIFIVLIAFSYKLTDYYISTLNNPDKTFTYWPNLLVFFDVNKDPKEEIRQKHTKCNYIEKNPWIHLMISKRVDTAIDEFCCLCLRDFVYPWLSTITHDDSFVYETKHVFRHLLATFIRRFQNVDINTFMVKRFFPLLFQTCDRYIQTKDIDSITNSKEFLKQMYKNDLHIAMYNRRNELKYLKKLLIDLMPIITPNFIYECQGSRDFLRELFVCQILMTGIDSICQPSTINRLFHIYFTNLTNPLENVQKSDDTYVEILSHFCAMNGELHKNHLSIELTDIMYEKELMNQFSRVLDRHGSLGLLSIYLSLSDILNDIPLAADVLVRKKLYQRLKHIDERYLNPDNNQSYIMISDPSNDQDTLLDDIKYLIYNTLEESINNENEKKSDGEKRVFDVQQTFTLLSKFHCKVYELIEEKYQRGFLTSDEHFLYICGQRMDSTDYRNKDQNFDENELDFVHIEDIRNSNENIHKHGLPTNYTTTSYQEMEEKDDAHLKCPEDTASISSSSSLDERDLSTWRIRINNIEELRENSNTNSKYYAFLIEVQRLDSNSDNPSVTDEEKPHSVVARRYQDFYLLEQKLTEFHGIFYDARLPPKRSQTLAKNFEYLESVKNDFQHFLQHLISKPTLRNSELLYHFLTQPDEFSLPNAEIILTKMFKSVPLALRIEKGQSLEPFLISLLNYIEPAKPKASQPIPVFTDIIDDKLQNSIYGNNADIATSFEDTTSEKPVLSIREELDSTYDHLVFIAQRIFRASPIIIHLLDLFRIPLKNTFNTFFSYFIDNKMDEVLNDDENIIKVIYTLRDTLFPNDVKDQGPTDLLNFEDVMAAAKAFMPNVVKRVIGEMNVENGLQIVLQHFQDPLLNKQLFYMILDEMIYELFPESHAHSSPTTVNTDIE